MATLPSKPPVLVASGLITAREALAEFGRGKRVVGLTKGQFSLLDLIRAALEHTGPAFLTLSTWTMGIRDADNAAFLITQGELLGLRLLVDRSFPTRQARYCRKIRATFGDAAIRATNTHAKIAMLSNDDGWRVTIRSSMNLNRNPRFEQFDIDDNASIFDHFNGWVDELEAITAPGPSQPQSVVNDAFAAALDGLTTRQHKIHRKRVERRQQKDARRKD
jgi:hypothetical protein